MAMEYTDANFQEKVLDSDKLTMIDFWAEWCGPCRAIGPVVEELSKEYDGTINVGKVNVDENPQLSVKYGITSIPAILFVKGGEVVDKLSTSPNILLPVTFKSPDAAALTQMALLSVPNLTTLNEEPDMSKPIEVPVALANRTP